jgi:hypothetical protein
MRVSGLIESESPGIYISVEGAQLLQVRQRDPITAFRRSPRGDEPDSEPDNVSTVGCSTVLDHYRLVAVATERACGV